MPLALIVEDDKNSLAALAELVAREGYKTLTAENLAEARKRILESRPEVILCDLVLPDGKGIALLRDIQKAASTEMILITANASVETAVEALRLGAYDYLTKPIDFTRLKMLLEQLNRSQGLREEVSELRHELRRLGHFGPLVGTSAAMQTVYDLIERVAPKNVTVFITGQSGTGKELVAETVHRLSRRRGARFLPVNCGAISPTLIESELFGHERGSFTGAQKQHHGYFERANGGTLLLDEVTEMPIELQVKLLRVLETGKIVRIGGDAEIPVDVRILAATNRDPKDAVKDGKLREDLYYRLNVFPIHVPVVRERDGDAKLLAHHFLAELNRAEKSEKRFSPEALKRIVHYSWPGNVRELRNVVERAFILADEEIGPESFSAQEAAVSEAPGPFLQIRIGSRCDEVDKRLILATLSHYGGDKGKCASVLGISLKTLYNRLREYRADDPGARGGDENDENPDAA